MHERRWRFVEQSCEVKFSREITFICAKYETSSPDNGVYMRQDEVNVPVEFAEKNWYRVYKISILLHQKELSKSDYASSDKRIWRYAAFFLNLTVP